MATTPEAIRARIATVIAALTPTSHVSDKFREHRNEDVDFIEDSETKPASAFRRFQVIETGDDEPPETSSGTDEERTATYRVTVAYPRDARAGDGHATARHRLMREDQRLIERAIGMHGKPNFTPPNPDATWLNDGSSTDRQEGQACDYLVITQRMLFGIEW